MKMNVFNIGHGHALQMVSIILKILSNMILQNQFKILKTVHCFNFGIAVGDGGKASVKWGVDCSVSASKEL